MARTVKVNLDVDEQPYVRGVQRAEHATERLDDAVDDLGASAKTTTAGMGKAKDSIGGVGTRARTTTRDLDRLGEQIRETELRVKALGDQIRRSGGDADLLKRFGAERSQLARLRAVRRVLGEIGDAAQDAAKFSLRGLTGAIEALPQQLKGAVIIGAAGAAIAATPAIGAALTGAIVGAVSTGAIAAGIAGAARSPEVKAAWDDLAAEGKNAFIVFSQPFVEPTVQAIQILQAALVDMRTDIGLIGQDASRLVEPLTRGVAGFVRQMIPGIRALVREAGPVFEMLEDELPRLGRAVGDFFDDLGDGAEGGADALRALLRVVEFSLGALGEWLKFLSDIVEGSEFISSRLGGALNFLFERGPELEQMGETGETAFGRFEESAKTAEDKVKDFNAAIDDAFDKTKNLDQASIDFKLGLLGLRDALAENGRAIDDSSEAGLRNRDVLLQMIDEAKGMRDAAIEQGNGTREATDVANAAYDDQLDQIRRVAVAFGLSAAEVDRFIDRYRTAALQPNITKIVKVKFLSQGDPRPAAPFGQIIAQAHGGLVTGPGPKGIDSQLRLLAPGEFVLSAKTVDRLGVDTLEALNAGQASAAKELLAHINAGGQVFEDFSFAGMSRNLGRFNDTLSRQFSATGQVFTRAAAQQFLSSMTASQSAGDVEVRVFIGDRELTDIVRVEMRQRDRGLRRRAMAGAGVSL